MTSVRSRPGRLKAVVWLLLGLTVSATAFAAGTDPTGAEMPAEAIEAGDRGLAIYMAALAEDAGGPASVAAPAATPGAVVSPGAPIPGRYLDPQATGVPQAAEDAGSATDDLPAWRWRAFDLDADTGGWLSPLKQIPVMAAEFFFQIAMFIWQILLMVIRFGLYSEIIVRIGARPVNAGFAFIADRLVFLAPLFFAVIVWRVATNLLKGRATQALRSGVIFILAFAVLSGMAYQAERANDAGDPTGVRYPGSPGWIGVTALDFGSKIVAPLTGLVQGAQGESLVADVGESCEQLEGQGDGGCLQEEQRDQVAGHFNCGYYVTAMHNRYEASGGEGTLAIMSRFWESTFLKSWAMAAFGLPGEHDLPNRAICHWAEEKSDQRLADRWQLAQEAGALYPVTPNIFGGTEYFIFGPFNGDQKDLRKAITGFAACTNTGSGWTTHPTWRGLDGEDTKLDKACGEAFAPASAGDANVDDNNDTDSFGDLEFYGGRVNDWTDGAQREALSEARYFGLSFSGDGSTTRIAQGMIAVLVAIAFLMTLGFIGIGLFIASLMAVTGLLLALPLAILAFAFESDKAKSLLKMTASSLMAKTMFTLLLSALILMSGLFQALLNAGIPLPGFFKSLAYGLSPVLAMFIIRAVLKSVGMADIMTPSGALTFATSAALKASGDRRMQQFATVSKDGQNGLQRTMGKNPRLGRAMGKADRVLGGAVTGSWTTFGGRQRNRAAKATEDKALKKSREERHVARTAFRDKINGYRKSIDDFGVARTFGRKLKPKSKGGREEALERLATLGTIFGAGSATVAGVRHPFSGAGDAAVSFKEGDYVTGLEAKLTRAGSTKTLNPHLDNSTQQILQQLKRDYPDLGDGAAKKQAREEAVAALVAGISRANIGTDDLLSPAQIEQVRSAAATALGYDRSEILVTANGIAVPDASAVGIRRAEATPEQLRSYVQWIPEHERQVQQIMTPNGMRNETEDEFAARILGIGIARGMIGPDGRQIDVLALNGLDINDEQTRERIRRWQQGEADKLLDRLTVGSANSSNEARLVADLQAATRRARFDAGAQERAQWDERVTIIREVVEQVPGKSQELTSAAAQTQQAVLGMSVASELLQKARAGGDTDAIAQAAERMDRAVDQFQIRLEALEERHLEMSLHAVEMASMAAAKQGATDGIEKILETGLAQLTREHQRLVKTAEDLLNGAANLDQFKEVVDEVADSAKKAAAAGVKQFTEEVIDRERDAAPDKRLPSTSPRTGTAKRAKSVRAEADLQGHDPIPEQ